MTIKLEWNSDKRTNKIMHQFDWPLRLASERAAVCLTASAQLTGWSERLVDHGKQTTVKIYVIQFISSHKTITIVYKSHLYNYYVCVCECVCVCV